MTRHAPGHRSHCPISFALDIVGDRWTLLVLRDLLMRGKQTYGDLLASEEGIATNVLADRLAWLEEQEILQRARRGGYRVTRKGLDLLPAILELVRWSAKYDPLSAAPPPLVKRIAVNQAQVVADVVTGYTETRPVR
jgi:DNA-binding HxlR family transcriptional regulator